MFDRETYMKEYWRNKRSKKYHCEACHKDILHQNKSHHEKTKSHQNNTINRNNHMTIDITQYEKLKELKHILDGLLVE